MYDICIMHKIEKVNELIRQELAKIIFEEESEPGILTTLMAAETSPDLRHTTVTISVYPTEKGESTLKKLSSRIFFLQQLLNKKLKIHPVPKIRFVLDGSGSESQKINTLLEKIK